MNTELQQFKILTEKLDRIDDAVISAADKFAEYLTSGKDGIKLTTSQLRKFYGEVKRMQLNGYDDSDNSEFKLLKPKLAYAVGRRQNKDNKIKDLYEIISSAIDQVHNKTDFDNFIKMFEAIVAYHKYHENKN